MQCNFITLSRDWLSKRHWGPFDPSAREEVLLGGTFGKGDVETSFLLRTLLLEDVILGPDSHLGT